MSELEGLLKNWVLLLIAAFCAKEFLWDTFRNLFEFLLILTSDLIFIEFAVEEK